MVEDSPLQPTSREGGPRSRSGDGGGKGAFDDDIDDDENDNNTGDDDDVVVVVVERQLPKTLPTLFGASTERNLQL